MMLGYFGAEVIKVEPPGKGDPIRSWRHLQGDTSLWWRSLARNKRCVAIDPDQVFVGKREFRILLLGLSVQAHSFNRVTRYRETRFWMRVVKLQPSVERASSIQRARAVGFA